MTTPKVKIELEVDQLEFLIAIFGNASSSEWVDFINNITIDKTKYAVKFQIGYDPEANVHIGRSVSLKGVHAEGETLEELFENIKAATSDILDIEMNG